MISKYPSTTKVLCATSIASLIAASSADATVHSYTFSSGNTYTSGSTLLYVDIDGGTLSTSGNVANSKDFRFCSFSMGNAGNIAIGGKNNNSFIHSFKEVVSGGKILALNKSASIGKSLVNFAAKTGSFIAPTGTVSAGTRFTLGQANYIGFSFLTNGKTCYGWIKFDLETSGSNVVLTVLAWAYDDSGATIKAGITSVPEPAETAIGLGALALGAAGLRRWRKAKAA
jgi:hypothetical protein